MFNGFQYKDLKQRDLVAANNRAKDIAISRGTMDELSRWKAPETRETVPSPRFARTVNDAQPKERFMGPPNHIEHHLS